MTSNSDGLSPSLKPFLGVGHNRALPAPFGFDNAYEGDGGNDYFTIPRLIGTVIPNDVSFEVFFKNTALQNFFFLIGNTRGTSGFYMGSSGNNTINIGTNFNATAYGRAGVVLQNDGGLSHIVGSFSRSLDRSSKSGVYRNGGNGADPVNGQSFAVTNFISTIGSDNLFGEPITVNTALIGVSDSVYGTANYYSKGKWDEFRMYKKCLTGSEARAHWNFGNGNNPSSTENLVIWYKFQEFEMLDFSSAQDGSDMRLGLRDHSGNNYHAQPINMDTNPASPTYVLKPF